MNSINIIGRLTEDPQQIPVGSDPKGVSMRLAFDQVSGSGYIEVALWDQRNTDACLKHLHKGDEIGVSGRLAYRSWTNGGGDARSAITITAARVDFLRKSKGTRQHDTEPAYDSPQTAREREKQTGAWATGETPGA
jgi:single-stranded DNA-binding protein